MLTISAARWGQADVYTSDVRLKTILRSTSLGHARLQPLTLACCSTATFENVSHTVFNGILTHWLYNLTSL